MTDNAQSIGTEDLVLTLHTLIEHNQELLAEIKAKGTINDEHAHQIASMVKQLNALLKASQAKEQLITERTSQVLKNNINEVFKENQAAYHALIVGGFNSHIDEATKHLSKVAVKATKQLEDLETAADNSKTEFESRREFFKMYEDTYDTQSRELKESVNKTMTQVLSDTTDKLDDIGSDLSYKLAKQLSWKVTTMLGAVCISIMLLTFVSAWLFIPSKADIAERRASYLELERYQVADNVGKGTDGYYADVIASTCFKGREGKTWCKFR